MESAFINQQLKCERCSLGLKVPQVCVCVCHFWSSSVALWVGSVTSNLHHHITEKFLITKHRRRLYRITFISSNKIKGTSPVSSEPVAADCDVSLCGHIFQNVHTLAGFGPTPPPLVRPAFGQ